MFYNENMSKKIIWSGVLLIIIAIIIFIAWPDKKTDSQFPLAQQIIGEWTLYSFNDELLDLSNASNTNKITISQDNISGNFCNVFGSDQYQIDIESNILTASTMSTQMFCDDEVKMKAEQAMLTGLYYGFDTAISRNNELILEDVDNLLVFISNNE